MRHMKLRKQFITNPNRKMLIFFGYRQTFAKMMNNMLILYVTDSNPPHWKIKSSKLTFSSTEQRLYVLAVTSLRVSACVIRIVGNEILVVIITIGSFAWNMPFLCRIDKSDKCVILWNDKRGDCGTLRMHQHVNDQTFIVDLSIS